MADLFNLKGFTDVFSTTLNTELQDNLVEFFDWGLLQKGNYFNVTLNETGTNGVDMSQLRLSDNVNYTKGCAWEGFRGNWVWQSGIPYSPSPIISSSNSKPGISGVYVNNTFYPTTTTGTYAHYVDYFNGRVVFNNPLPTGSKVQAEYSYKYINVIYANSLPWLTEIQYRTVEPQANFQVTTNEFNVPTEMRVQLPAIAIEIVPRRTLRGYQLGGGQFIENSVLFHCLAEDGPTRDKLLDIVSLQNDKTIYMFDSNTIAASGKFPLDYRGTPVSGALRYPELIMDYPKSSIRLRNSIIQGVETINTNFYAGIVRLTAEVIDTKI